jgi:hypothetical protein
LQIVGGYEFYPSTDPDEPESENHTAEQPLSGPTSGMVITSTPAGRFVYWPDRKPADLTDGNSRCITYLDSLPFQEGTPLAPAEEHTPTEVGTSDSSLSSPDRQVFITTNETPGPSGTRPNRYLKDISADKLSANAPVEETDDNKNARRERNRRRNERRRRLRETHTESRRGSRPSRKPGAHYPRTVPHVYHHNSTSGSGDVRGRSHRQAREGRLLHES